MNTLNYNSILLIDDDEDDCLLFEEALSEITNDLKVKCIHSIDNLLHVIDKTKPSLIFIDLHLPRLNGIECLRLIRNHPGYEHIPVICWSGFSNTKDISAAYLEGASYYFEKPYTLKNLRLELSEILVTNNIILEESNQQAIIKKTIAI